MTSLFTTNRIPVMRPLLPKAEAIIPYLHQIDKNQWYSNFGPLVESLETRFESMFSLEHGTVLTLSSGTAALTNALRAWNVVAGSYCIVPAWTFIGTAAAVCAAELKPYFVDVDEETWALNPEVLKTQLRYIAGRVSAVVVVSPFGKPIDIEAWEAFRQETGIHVLVDAAASFDAVHTDPMMRLHNHVPIMVSLHATKPFGVGEGGLILAKNTKWVYRVQEMSNFGFAELESDEIIVPGTNGKMSEYAAAVGHATMDSWDDRRALWVERKNWYQQALKGVPVQVHMNGDWISSTFCIRLQESQGTADSVLEAMREHGIECRKWWRNGCHRQVAYGEYPRLPLPVTEALAKSVIALPFRLDSTQEEIEFVVGKLKTCLRG